MEFSGWESRKCGTFLKSDLREILRVRLSTRVYMVNVKLSTFSEILLDLCYGGISFLLFLVCLGKKNTTYSHLHTLFILC